MPDRLPLIRRFNALMAWRADWKARKGRARRRRTRTRGGGVVSAAKRPAVLTPAEIEEQCEPIMEAASILHDYMVKTAGRVHRDGGESASLPEALEHLLASLRHIYAARSALCGHVEHQQRVRLWAWRSRQDGAQSA